MKENVLEFCSWTSLYSRYGKNLVHYVLLMLKKNSEIVTSFNVLFFLFTNREIYIGTVVN